MKKRKKKDYSKIKLEDYKAPEKCGCTDIIDEDWDIQEIDWSGKTFYIKRIFLFLHIPLFIGRDIKQMFGEIKNKGYKIKEPRRIIQKDGRFRGALITEIEKPKGFDEHVHTPERLKLFSKVSFLHWSHLWKDVKKLVKACRNVTGKKAKSVYLMYVTCPKCIKERGYKTVILGKISE